MLQLRQHLPRGALRPMLLGAVGLTLLGGVVLVAMRSREGGVTLVSAPPTAVVSQAVTRNADTALPVVPTPKPLDPKPSFDTLRVSPQGNVVIAGTAGPQQTVVIRDGAHEIGQATADAAGQWVLVPDQPLAPGARELTLAARTPAGAVTPGQASVLLVVPAPAAPQTALAVLTPRPGTDDAPRVLQTPLAPGLGGRNARLDLDVGDYDDHGAMSFAGHAPPGAHVRVYVDDKPVADTLADAQARWTEKPGMIAPGPHRIRVDQFDPQGKVISRVELPFTRGTPPPAPLAAGQIVVQPGATLWRLARQVYGQGMRYTVIYAYNSSVIRDPNRIYPGQIFAMPDATTAAASPAPLPLAK